MKIANPLKTYSNGKMPDLFELKKIINVKNANIPLKK